MGTKIPRRRIEAVLFDAMNTILEVRGSYRELLGVVYRRHLGRETDPERLYQIYQRARLGARHEPDFSLHWARIHRNVLAEFRKLPERKVSLREGRAIHEAVMSDTSLYRVPRETRAVLAFARRHFRLAVASNQERRFLVPMLARKRIAGYFERVFSSDEFGTSKPSPEFFQRAFAEFGVSPERACYVGNSVRNDLPARLVGCRLILIDRGGETGISLPRTVVVRSMGEVREELERLAAGNR